MSRYRFELATPADDSDLRAILAATPMPGAVSVGFRREPSFFAGSSVDGPFRQIVACRDSHTGKLVGFGCRSVRDRFVNGEVQPIGYLGTLRLLDGHRNHGLVARGYRYFKDLHEDARTRLYLTTIAADNAPAQKILTGGRAGLPVYHDAGLFHTALVSRMGRARSVSDGRTEVRAATHADLPALLGFLGEVGPSRQFFPSYSAADFDDKLESRLQADSDGGCGHVPRPAEAGTPTLFGLRLSDIMLALRGGQIVGTLAAWDQRAYRQTVVHGYARPLSWLRPAYNVWSRWRGRPGLPAPGAAINVVSAALSLVRDDDLDVFAQLVHSVCARLGPEVYLALGLHEHDPLRAALRGFAARRYVTRLYHVCWADGDTLRKTLDARPPYLELGTL